MPDARPGEAFADSKVAELQRTASDVQRELGSLAGEIHNAEQALQDASAALGTARTVREQADEAVRARQADVDQYVSALFGSFGRPNQLQVLLLARSPEDFLDGSSLMARVQEAEAKELTGATRRREAAVTAEQAAEAAAKAATDRKADLDRRNGDATNRAAAITSEFRGKLASANAAVVAMQQAQRTRNEQTATNWRAYTDKLAVAGIKPGADAFEATLQSGERLLVLPAVTIQAVTAAVGALGKPYVPRGDGPDAYSCDGLTRSIYGLAGSAAEQMAVLQPVPDPQPGDLVFVGPERYGVQSVGVALDPRTMITADARLVGVVVTDIPPSVLGYARPALPRRPAQPVPQRTDNGLVWRCGGVDLPSGGWSGYPNGLIPPTALCGVGIGTHALRCDAAQAFRALAAEFSAAFGRTVCVTDSYRTFDEQVRLYGVKPALAAVPGTSNHGWGLAVDLCGGAQSYGTPEYAWLRANAGRYGWSNPVWALPGRGREEPWHWEFGGD
ncbi:cell wall-associated NlpC family hydrolase [Kibdelosporangium banguiense]|uniref:Cell wall-associated NlpC family hydrolase n=1 Tax=Kibdelosporangium banguiense TaxID=1365924 RepID=A0ABS4U4J8_9PSEU|nr:D-alanyl-D-alanine carboxypeptidase family protein [Kibdelosporangium banguiense]MBP2331130.1 cell wall-associated NlpC family hydrolase [Kibdelosporangium banguiense]